ncbi:MAG: flagellar hook-basal body complex protein FliE [Phycisphaerales bacterium]|jgi:flagellar hook-basal body complex protein FliE|nr:flagellar hook-basal body complex protein FliE [Phycisphaerales bacterium]
MTPINPIQTPGAAIPTPQISGIGQKNAPTGKSDFAGKLGEYIDQVDETQKASAGTVENLLSGKTQDILPTVAAVAKADMSFKLLIGVRNKVIEAYKQTMNMQI